MPSALPVSSLLIKGEFFDLDLISDDLSIHFFDGSNKVIVAVFPSAIDAEGSPNILLGFTASISTALCAFRDGMAVCITAYAVSNPIIPAFAYSNSRTLLSVSY